jgi:fumarate reductase flavoprotein subunit
LPGWLILVNKQGRRFTNEAAPYTVLGGLIQNEGGHAFAVFDETARTAAKPSPISQANWVSDRLHQKAEEGRIFREETLEDLAAAMQVDVGGLLGTVERYNNDVASGSDTAFFKGEGLQSVTSAPFYGVEIRPAIVCWTGTGVRVSADTAVMNKQEKSIPGLYAAGETIGNLHGDRYIGGGGSFGPCIVFGKLAGENAARYSRALND